MLRLGLLLVAFLFHAGVAAPADAAKRVALVIGNAAYAKAGTLANPANDATDVANALKKFGFDVILGIDLDRTAFNDKLRAFSEVLENADDAVLCQSASNRNPGSACKKDPHEHPFVRFSAAILPSRPMRLLSRRAERRSRTAAFAAARRACS
jgi:hypothetical protein